MTFITFYEENLLDDFARASLTRNVLHTQIKNHFMAMAQLVKDKETDMTREELLERMPQCVAKALVVDMLYPEGDDP